MKKVKIILGTIGGLLAVFLLMVMYAPFAFTINDNQNDYSEVLKEASLNEDTKVTTYFDYDTEHYSFQDNRDIDKPRPVANGVTRGDSISPYIPHYASYYLRPNHIFWMFFTFSGSTKAKLTDFNIVFGTRNDNAEGKIDVLQELFIYSSISGKNALLLEVEVSAAKEYYVRVDNDGDINKVPYHLYAFWF